MKEKCYDLLDKYIQAPKNFLKPEESSIIDCIDTVVYTKETSFDKYGKDIHALQSTVDKTDQSRIMKYDQEKNSLKESFDTNKASTDEFDLLQLSNDSHALHNSPNATDLPQTDSLDQVKAFIEQYIFHQYRKTIHILQSSANSKKKL